MPVMSAASSSLRQDDAGMGGLPFFDGPGIDPVSLELAPQGVAGETHCLGGGRLVALGILEGANQDFPLGRFEGIGGRGCRGSDRLRGHHLAGQVGQRKVAPRAADEGMLDSVLQFPAIPWPGISR